MKTLIVRDRCTKQNKSGERQVPDDFTHRWNVKKQSKDKDKSKQTLDILRQIGGFQNRSTCDREAKWEGEFSSL